MRIFTTGGQDYKKVKRIKQNQTKMLLHRNTRLGLQEIFHEESHLRYSVRSSAKNSAALFGNVSTFWVL